MKNLSTIAQALLTLAFALPFSLSAQTECSIQHFNTSNGLPQNTITGMAFDSTGFFWLGTQNGLIRYDGAVFRTFLYGQTDSRNSISNTVVDISSIRPQKKLLIRMKDGLVYSTENGIPKLYSNAIKNAANYYQLDGRFPSLSIFDRFNLPVAKLTEEQKWNPEINNVLPVNAADFIVAAADRNNVLYYNNGEEQRTIKINDHFKNFLKSGSDNLLLSDDFKLYLFNTAAGDFDETTVEWPNNKIESGNSNSFFLWDKQNDQSYYFHDNIVYLLSVNPINRSIKFIPRFSIKSGSNFWTGITYDSAQSTYFLSTLRDGFFRVKLKEIQTVVPEQKSEARPSSTGNRTYALLKTSDSTAITPDGFELKSDENRQIVVDKKGNISGNSETIARLGDTAILCVQENKLVYYSKADGFKEKKEFNESFNKNYPSFVSLLQPEGDSVWACSDIGIFSLKGKNANAIFFRKRDNQSLNFGPRLFYRVSNDEVFFSNNLGLFKLKTSQPYAVDTFPAMKDRFVSGIVKYNDVLLLAVYKYGLFIFKDNAFKKVPIAESQTELSFCHSLFIDKNENVWVTTDKGLYKTTMASIMESVAKLDANPFFFYYGENDGIANPEFTGGYTPSYALLPNGQLFFPSSGGVVIVDPEKLSSDFGTSQIFIDKIQIDDKEMDSTVLDHIELNPDFKLLAIDFAVPYFGEPENLLLEYKLDDDGWKRITRSPAPRIVLYELSSGDYQLSVRKRKGFKNDDFVFKNLIIHRQKHFYEQLWFYPLMILTFFLLIFLIIRWRRKRINRQRKELQVQVTEQTAELSKAIELDELLINIISQDMIAPLQQVTLLAGSLRNQDKKNPEEIAAGLSDIRSTSEKILTGSRGIINYMKYNNSNADLNRQTKILHEVVEEVCRSFYGLSKAKNVRISNEVNESVFIEIDETIFSIILSNLINNAFENDGVNEVMISLEPSTPMKEIILNISDNGKAMNDEMLKLIQKTFEGKLDAIKVISKTNSGLAYILVSELSRIHDFSVTIKNKPTGGTIVSIAIQNRKGNHNLFPNE